MGNSWARRIFIYLFRARWTHLSRPYAPVSLYEPRLLLDCEKDPQQYVDVQQVHVNLIARLKRREAADADFEAQVMALLAPVKKRLAEMARDSGESGPAAHDPAAAKDQHAAPDLPPAPQIFYGRDYELSALVGQFSQGGQAHTALLGPEGAGKSALALALLHHPEIVRKFGARRFFVECETSANAAGVCLRIASALGIPHTPSKDCVLSALTSFPGYSLIVLDDLEFPPALKELLADLSALPHVSLILTLRGARPPSGPTYTTPHPAPLGPLLLPVARAIFRAISDLPAAATDDDMPTDVDADASSVDAAAALIDALLQRAGVLPGAIVLLAQRAQYEPLPFLFARCAKEGGV
ncbi:hypothetical protein B0H17DRAFT_1144325 [Mycena rosella]|uniref:ORC1/DEAH AAA+ ATPase domain-containing protein n=1 Tax=Mycena rosella TaxID=1033263 RepID=A0AAD7CTG0_MYCRO|nr:hypothetical protein B0H17DRAFT_1144325 [Mycena rosella]